LDFKDKDEKEVIKFGTDPSAEKMEEESKDWSAWLFSFKGQLMVISVLYQAGSHIPQIIRHLQLISEDLQKLHALKLKHGDLRLWNMVFDDNKAALIDFDFSGKKFSFQRVTKQTWMTHQVDRVRHLKRLRNIMTSKLFSESSKCCLFQWPGDT
jgi:Ser/Thr protein kinase RdoA (MazF antagonist)